MQEGTGRTNGCTSESVNQEEGCGNDISCFSKIAGTLTGEEIMDHGLIIPDSKSNECLQATTYDLTLGEGHYVYNGKTSDKKEKWDLVFIGSDERLEMLNNKNSSSEQYKRINRDKPKTLFIPPYGSAFVQLNETVDTYTVAKEKKLLIVGRFDLKLSQVHQGLISQQATQVEPCYRGKLFCFIHNLSNQQIELKYGDKIATIEFSYVSCFCNQNKRNEIIDMLLEKNKGKYNTLFCNEAGIDEVRYFHAEEKLPNDCGLLGLNEKVINLLKSEEVIDDMAKRVKKKVDRWGVWVPVLVAMIGGIVSIVVALINLNYTNQIKEVKDQIVEMADETEIDVEN